MTPPANVRVAACDRRQFNFLFEPMPAVRLNYHARFTAKEGSQEWLYVRWKDEMRDLFDQIDYRDHEVGIPFDEPLSVGGTFLVSSRAEAKDLDNLVKAFFDAMNPVRKKNFSELRTFLWVDDKQIKQFDRWRAIPSRDPRIDVTLTPLWGRVDPNLHYIDGTPLAMGGGVHLVNTAADYPFHCLVPEGVDAPSGACRLWVLTSTGSGVHVVGSRPEQAVLFRELVNLPGVSEDTALKVFGAKWEDVLNVLAGGSTSVGVARADRALAQLRELFADPEKRMIELAEKFDQTAFDQTAMAVSQRAKVSWSLVRRSLVSMDLDWCAGLDAVVNDATKAIEERHAKRPRKSKSSTSGTRRRAAH